MLPESTTTQSESTRRSKRLMSLGAYDLLRIVLSVILLTAGLLKVHELSTVPYLDNFPPRWLMVVFIELELLFAIWLLFGRLPRLTHRVTLLLFTMFSCVTLYKAAIGETSCGCFGQVEINPWYTFVFDIGVVGLLLWTWPKGDLEFTDLRHLARWRIPGTTAIAVIWLIFAAPSTWMILSFAETDAHADLSVLGTVFDGPDGKPVVMLEPENWVGKEFPLLDYIEADEDSAISLKERLSEGAWNVVLVHRTCPDCKELLQQLADPSVPLPKEFDAQSGIAIIELPEEGNAEEDICGGHGLLKSRVELREGCLKNEVNWLVNTPVILKVNDGEIRETNN